jgi:hypothetical protein
MDGGRPLPIPGAARAVRPVLGTGAAPLKPLRNYCRQNANDLLHQRAGPHRGPPFTYPAHLTVAASRRHHRPRGLATGVQTNAQRCCFSRSQPGAARGPATLPVPLPERWRPRSRPGGRRPPGTHGGDRVIGEAWRTRSRPTPVGRREPAAPCRTSAPPHPRAWGHRVDCGAVPGRCGPSPLR